MAAAHLPERCALACGRGSGWSTFGLSDKKGEVLQTFIEVRRTAHKERHPMRRAHRPTRPYGAGIPGVGVRARGRWDWRAHPRLAPWALLRRQQDQRTPNEARGRAGHCSQCMERRSQAGCQSGPCTPDYDAQVVVCFARWSELNRSLRTYCPLSQGIVL